MCSPGAGWGVGGGFQGWAEEGGGRVGSPRRTQKAPSSIQGLRAIPQGLGFGWQQKMEFGESASGDESPWQGPESRC